MKQVLGVATLSLLAFTASAATALPPQVDGQPMPSLAPIVQRLRLAGDRREAVPLLALARQAGFPANTLGRRVTAGRHTGEVVRLSPDGRQFWLVNERTGAELLIDAGFWQSRADQARQPADPSKAEPDEPRSSAGSSGGPLRPGDDRTPPGEMAHR